MPSFLLASCLPFPSPRISVPGANSVMIVFYLKPARAESSRHNLRKRADCTIGEPTYAVDAHAVPQM